MPWQPNYYHPPAVYAETQVRRQQDAQRQAQRLARAGKKKLEGVLQEHGEQMSDEGRGLVEYMLALAKTVGKALGTR